MTEQAAGSGTGAEQQGGHLRRFLKMLQEREKAHRTRKASYGGSVRPLVEIRKDEEIRCDRIAALKKLGIKAIHDDKKLYWRELNSGCEACGSGEWTCFFISSKCTRHCFYCPQCPKVKAEDVGPSVDNRPVKSDQELIEAMRKAPRRACGISGGEPFLVFDRLEATVRALRETFGDDFWIHVYTNGDLVTEKGLRRLERAGLNEIRFNPTDSDYDLTALELACKVFPYVTVEIPAIPCDEERIHDFILAIDRLGVRMLNLHELTANAVSRDEHWKRGLRAKNDGQLPPFLDLECLPIVGSEEMGWRVLEFIVTRELSLNVNQCTFAYKRDVQLRGRDRSLAQAHVAASSDKTIRANSIGLIERVVISSPSPAEVAQTLRRKGIPDDAIAVHGDMNRVDTHVDSLWLMDFDDLAGCEVGIVGCDCTGNIRALRILKE